MGHRGDGFWAAADRGDMGEGIEITLAGNLLLDGGQEVAKADASEKDHDVDLAGDQAVGEIDGLAIMVNRNFAHAGADERTAAEFFDEAGDFGGVTAFEGGDAEVVKRGCAASHGYH